MASKTSNSPTGAATGRRATGSDTNSSDSSDEFSRLAELEKVLTRLWEALDGTRQVEAGTDRKSGEAYYATENAAPVAREIRAALAEIEALHKSQAAKGSGVDELARQRAARIANAERRATPTRQRR